MKKEINLRTKDMKLPQQLYLSRLTFFLAVILFFLLLIAVIIFSNVYRDRLQEEKSLLTKANQQLLAMAAPVVEKEKETELMRERTETENTLRNRTVHWTEHISDIEKTAGDLVDITLISGVRNENIMIDGKSPALEKIAVYTQKLQDLDFLEETAFEYTEYNIKQGAGSDDIPAYESKDSFYRFTIFAELSVDEDD